MGKVIDLTGQMFGSCGAMSSTYSILRKLQLR